MSIARLRVQNSGVVAREVVRLRLVEAAGEVDWRHQAYFQASAFCTGRWGLAWGFGSLGLVTRRVERTQDVLKWTLSSDTLGMRKWYHWPLQLR